MKNYVALLKAIRVFRNTVKDANAERGNKIWVADRDYRDAYVEAEKKLVETINIANATEPSTK